jgi:hypothetical protein
LTLEDTLAWASSLIELVNEFTERMTQGLEEAKSAIAKVKDEYAMYYNCQ